MGPETGGALWIGAGLRGWPGHLQLGPHDGAGALATRGQPCGGKCLILAGRGPCRGPGGDGGQVHLRIRCTAQSRLAAGCTGPRSGRHGHLLEAVRSDWAHACSCPCGRGGRLPHAAGRGVLQTGAPVCAEPLAASDAFGSVPAAAERSRDRQLFHHSPPQPLESGFCSVGCPGHRSVSLGSAAPAAATTPACSGLAAALLSDRPGVAWSCLWPCAVSFVAGPGTDPARRSTREPLWSVGVVGCPRVLPDWNALQNRAVPGLVSPLRTLDRTAVRTGPGRTVPARVIVRGLRAAPARPGGVESRYAPGPRAHGTLRGCLFGNRCALSSSQHWPHPSPLLLYFSKNPVPLDNAAHRTAVP